jgi:hypothetical protein
MGMNHLDLAKRVLNLGSAFIGRDELTDEVADIASEILADREGSKDQDTALVQTEDVRPDRFHDHEPMSSDQRRALFAMLRDHGVDTADDYRFTILTAITDRSVDTFTDLTHGEARVALNTLAAILDIP